MYWNVKKLTMNQVQKKYENSLALETEAFQSPQLLKDYETSFRKKVYKIDIPRDANEIENSDDKENIISVPKLSSGVKKRKIWFRKILRSISKQHLLRIMNV